MRKYCPYCGRRISYFTTFHEKKRGIHTCTRCKKESKIKTDFRLIIAFIAVVLVVFMFMVVWMGSGNYNNFLGVIITAAILMVFYFSTPIFIRFVPLKKYRVQEEPKEEFEYEYEPMSDDETFPEESKFTFNRDVFDKVKEKRNSTITRNNAENSDSIEHTKIADKTYIPIINDVTESHASSEDVPLRRVNTPSGNYTDYKTKENFDDEVSSYVQKKVPKKPDGSRYTANRKL
ncbi:MAG: hypothetical protein J1E41_03670 [Ruminococcus sp.]|nr:hypothetical protein [Ruminococcus sp.]